ncbi:MAG: oxygenase MpaB family protein [Saprospiraceae bacterium]|nr:oxygenase MpaB family protein [Saprospiraceae bacterium]
MAGEANGYFGPESITWRLYREPIFLFGGMRALLLQIAHPSVADGVARYSNFKADPFGRGYRTFAAMATIYFGTKEQAEKTAKRLQQLHAGIRGELPQAYTANDPELLLWVFATLTDTTLQTYSNMPLRDLPADWKERFYEESKTPAALLGIPEGLYPPDLPAFKRYFSGMLESGLLGSAPVCREVAMSIVGHPRVPARLGLLLASGWLPPSLCEKLGLPVSNQPTERLARWLRRAYQVYRCIPRSLRQNPAYHQAMYRLAKASGEKPALAARFYHFLGKRWRIPLALPA